jgi:hypothetical protein
MTGLRTAAAPGAGLREGTRGGWAVRDLAAPEEGVRQGGAGAHQWSSLGGGSS